MTPEERAQKVVNGWLSLRDVDEEEVLFNRAVPDIATAIREAVDAERERCAGICDERYAYESRKAAEFWSAGKKGTDNNAVAHEIAASAVRTIAAEIRGRE